MKAEIGEGDDDVRHWSRVVGGLARWWGDGVARLREMANKETQPRGLDAVARDRLRVYCHSKEQGVCCCVQPGRGCCGGSRVWCSACMGLWVYAALAGKGDPAKERCRDSLPGG